MSWLVREGKCKNRYVGGKEEVDSFLLVTDSALRAFGLHHFVQQTVKPCRISLPGI